MGNPIGGIVSKATQGVTSGLPSQYQGLVGGLTQSVTGGVMSALPKEMTAGLNTGFALDPQTTRVGTGFGDTGARQVPLIGGVGGESFGDTLKRAINDVSGQQEKAADTLGAFLRGENVEIHQVMAASEEAQISLQMLIEVRNKFTEAYRSLANMQG